MVAGFLSLFLHVMSDESFTNIVRTNCFRNVTWVCGSQAERCIFYVADSVSSYVTRLYCMWRFFGPSLHCSIFPLVAGGVQLVVEARSQPVF